MSVVAKILIVLNLILAVVFLGSGATYLGVKETFKLKLETAEANWVTERKDLEDSRDNFSKKWRDQEAKTATAQTELADIQGRWAQKEEEYKQAAALQTKLQAAYDKLSETYRDAIAQVDTLRNEKNRLIDEKDQALTAKRTAIDAQNNAVTEQRRLESELQAANDTVDELKVRINEVSTKLASTEVLVKAYEDKYGPYAEAMTPPAIQAKVAAVDNGLNIVILTVGRDDEVKAGYEFTVYRDDKYIGRVVIDKVERDHCSGYSKKEIEAGAIQVGDDARTRY